MRGALRANKNVGGGGHDYDMSKTQTTGADTVQPMGPWLLTEVPLVDVDPQFHLR